MKQVRVVLGRFQPMTLGHLKMITYKCKGPETLQGFKGPINQKELLREQPNISDINKQKTVIFCIYTPKEKVDKKHPFDVDLMKKELEIVKKSYSDIEDIMYVPSADICLWGEMLKKAGYQASVWITGSDEAKSYVEMAMKVPEYEEHNRDNRDCKDAYTKSFYVESIERIEDENDFVSGISGTKVRQSLLDNDKDLFNKMMPKGVDVLFDEFKTAVENAPEKASKPSKKKIKEYLNDNMLTLHDYLITERFVNVHTSEDMMKYGKEVWDILQKSYEYCGGLAGMDSVEQLIDETDMWKMVRRNGKIVSVATYSKKRSGRKICYIGQDGSDEGKQGVKKILSEDFNLTDREAWTEVSGAMEVTSLKQGAMPIPAYLAELIMKDKKFDKVLEDGYHYIRQIGGAPHTKLMVGNFGGNKIKADDNLIKELIETAKKIGKEE